MEEGERKEGVVSGRAKVYGRRRRCADRSTSVRFCGQGRREKGEERGEERRSIREGRRKGGGRGG